jgi:ADP-ribosyl-[dinitrogen reductase] hydrolase
VHLSTTGYVLDTLTIAWYALIHTDDFESAVALAINLGGDADTQGALVGALVGARYGLSGIPDRWLAALQHRAHIDGLAQRILAIVGKTQRVRHPG